MVDVGGTEGCELDEALFRRRHEESLSLCIPDVIAYEAQREAVQLSKDRKDVNSSDLS